LPPAVIYRKSSRFHPIEYTSRSAGILRDATMSELLRSGRELLWFTSISARSREWMVILER
jgi:hypothetical protein